MSDALPAPERLAHVLESQAAEHETRHDDLDSGAALRRAAWYARLLTNGQAEAILAAMDAGTEAVFERRRELGCKGGDQVLTMLAGGA
jgi:hypothetical protein